jgi:APA family basic amino acid/polyamine antiporter
MARTVLFLGVTVSGLFRLRGAGGAEPGYRTPGYPVTPAIFLILVAVLPFLLAGNRPLQAALGAGIVALGLPVYWLACRRRLDPERMPSDDLDTHDPPPGSR